MGWDGMGWYQCRCRCESTCKVLFVILTGDPSFLPSFPGPLLACFLAHKPFGIEYHRHRKKLYCKAPSTTLENNFSPKPRPRPELSHKISKSGNGDHGEGEEEEEEVQFSLVLA